jgi:hypothetical protein
MCCVNTGPTGCTVACATLSEWKGYCEVSNVSELPILDAHELVHLAVPVQAVR